MGLPRYNEASYAHFVSTNTYQRRKIFRDQECCRILAEDLQFYKVRLAFEIIAYCIIPDHFHMIVQWDAEKNAELTISKIMAAIKSHSARRMVDYVRGRRGPLTSPNMNLGQGTQVTQEREYPRRRMGNQTYKIWQPSFYDFNIYTEKMLHQKVQYIHWNPVRAGLCHLPEGWQWSTVMSNIL